MNLKFERNLTKYAELAVKVGVNIQPNQYLYIAASIESASFVQIVTKVAYENGARQVFVDYTDDQVTRTRYELAPAFSFSFKFCPLNLILSIYMNKRFSQSNYAKKSLTMIRNLCEAHDFH